MSRGAEAMSLRVNPWKSAQAWLGCGLVLALCWCTEPQAGPSSGANDAAPAISRITLERDCSGCKNGLVLDLRSDGHVTRTLVGKARLGTVDEVRTARLAPGEFAALARLLVTQNYFEMQERYEDQELRDGTWATLTVTRAGQAKQVFRREDAGPPGLKVIETTLEGLQARISFGP